MGGPLKLKFAIHSIIYQNRPVRGRIVPGRLHLELCAWEVERIIEKSLSSGRFKIIDDRYQNQHLKFESGKNQYYCM